MITFEMRKAKKWIKWKNSENKLHRLGEKTASTYWHSNGKKSYEAYYVGGKLHRLNGPAFISWHSNGQKWSESYYVEGKRISK